MYGRELVQNVGFVPIPAQDLNDAAVGSEWIDMANYGHATVYISVGDTAGATFTVTLNEATSNAGAGEQTLAYTKYYSTGQRLNINTVSGTFAVGETITGGTSGLTAYVHTISSSYMLVIPLTGGTTWTTTETLTGGTSAATAVLDGTGQDEDILLDRTASSTFTVPAVTYKTYAIEIDAASLTDADGYQFFQVDLSDPGMATIASGCIILSQPRYRGLPMESSLGAQKIVSTS